MRFARLSNNFADSYCDYFDVNKHVEVVGSLRKGNGSVIYLIRKHLKHDLSGGAEYFGEVKHYKWDWTSYDGKSLLEHQGGGRSDNYLWAKLDNLTFIQPENKNVKHVLERLDN